MAFVRISYSQLTFTVSNLSGSYSITCTNTVINLVANSNYTASPVTYTWAGSQLSTVSSNSTSVLSVGTITVSASSGTLVASQTLAIGINTINPTLSVAFATNVVSCAVPSIVLQGSSTNANAVFLWSYAGGTLSTNSLVANVNFSLAPTNTLLGNYSLTVTDPVNQCKSFTVIPIYQNIYRPNAAITVNGPSVITCISHTVLLVNSSSTGIPPNSIFPNSLQVYSLNWKIPGQTGPMLIVDNYPAFIAGTYTLTARDPNNGCENTATFTVSDQRDYPNIIASPGYYTVSCPGGTVNLSPAVVGTTNLSFSWLYPAGANVSGSNTGTLTTNAEGIYTVLATDPSNGCQTQLTFTVAACVGISEMNKSDGWISVSPNPAGNELKFEIKGETVVRSTIQNAIGQTVYESNETVTEINVSGLPPGVYYLTLKTERGFGRQKFIKE